MPKSESKFYMVKLVGNLSKISKEFYGDKKKYKRIFETNRLFLKNTDDIVSE